MDQQTQTLNTLWHEMIDGIGTAIPEEQYPGFRQLSTLEIGVIGILSRQPDCKMKDISTRLHISKSTLTSVIDRLEKAGFLRRIINPLDRRSFTLQLCEKGETVQQEHETYEEMMFGRIMSALENKQDKEDFLRLFGKIVKNLQPLEELLHESRK